MLPVYGPYGVPQAAGLPQAAPAGGSSVPGRLVATGVATGTPFAVPSGAPIVAPPGFSGLPPLQFGPGGLPMPPPMPGIRGGQMPLMQIPPAYALARLRGLTGPPVAHLGAGTGLAPIAPVQLPSSPLPGSPGYGPAGL